MRWVAPSEKDTANEVPGKRLWAVADHQPLRANSSFTRAHRTRYLESGAQGLIILSYFLPARSAARPGRGYYFLGG